MTWRRFGTTVSVGWLLAVLLACGFEAPTAEVEGDRTMTGGDPCPVESCAPHETPIVFSTPRPLFSETTSPLPAVAVGSSTELSVRDSDAEDSELSIDGLEVGERRFRTWPVLAAEAGVFDVDYRRSTGELIDRTQLRVFPPIRIELRPIIRGLFREPLALGPSSGWVLWAGGRDIRMVKEVFASLGRRVVAIEDAVVTGAVEESVRQRGAAWDVLSFAAPTEGAVRVTVGAGELVRPFELAVVSAIDEVRSYEVGDCDFPNREDVCFVPFLDGRPIAGVDLQLRWRAEPESLDWLVAFDPCLQRLEEAHEIEIIAGGESWPFEIPATTCY